MNQQTIKKLEKLKDYQNQILEAEAGIEELFAERESFAGKEKTGWEMTIKPKVKLPKNFGKIKEPVRPGKKRRMDDQTREEILALMGQGKAPQDIANQLGLKYQTVWAFCNKNKDKKPDKVDVAKAQPDDDDEFTNEQINEI